MPPKAKKHTISPPSSPKTVKKAKTTSDDIQYVWYWKSDLDGDVADPASWQKYDEAVQVTINEGFYTKPWPDAVNVGHGYAVHFKDMEQRKISDQYRVRMIKKELPPKTTKATGIVPASAPPIVEPIDEPFFLGMVPDETTYDSTNSLITYNVHLMQLGESFMEWFRELWEVDHSTRESFLAASLGGVHPIGLHTICEDGGAPDQDTIDEMDFDSLKDYFAKNMKVEHEVEVGASTLRWGTDSEFDMKFAFLTGRSVENQELGDILSRLVRLNPDTKMVERVFHKVHRSSYLTK